MMRKALGLVAAAALIAATGVALADDRMDAFRDGIERAHQRLPKIDYRDHKPDAATPEKSGAIKADVGYAIPAQSTPDCAFEVPVADARTHDDYRRYPVSQHDILKPGERFRATGALVVSQRRKIGAIQFPAGVRGGGAFNIAVLLETMNDRQMEYLRDRCLEEMPCTSVFKITYLGSIKRPEMTKQLPKSADPMHCYDSYLAYIQVGGRGDLGTLDEWEP